MPKLKPDVQRARSEHILDAAERCFVRAGFHRTSIHDICKEAGISPGALYVYFDSKEALIAGISERDRAEFADRLATLATAPDFLEALRVLGEQYFLEEPADMHRMCIDIGLEFDPQPAHRRDPPALRPLHRRELREAVPEAEGRGPHRPHARHPDRGQSVHGHLRRHVLAPRRRSRIQSASGDAGRDAAHCRTPEAGASAWAGNCLRQHRKGVRSIMRKILIGAVLAMAFAMVSLTLVGKSLPRPTGPAESRAAKVAPADEAFAAVVTVARVAPADFIETVLASGSLVAREEILVGPEVEGLRITEVVADEGTRVKKGDVLARLVADTLDAQVAQNDAALARSSAAIAQAKASIVQAEARLVEGRNSLDRARPLRGAGHMTEAVFDQREQTARTAQAQLEASQDGLKLAEAEKAQVEAQRRELMWRRGRVEVTAPADGIVSRRMARVGGYAAGAAEPIFRIVAKGEVELDAEVIETRLATVKEGQAARVEVAGLGTISGTVRLVSPEVDKATRLGRVRIFLGDNPGLRVGAFARGVIATANGSGLAVPASGILYGPDGPTVQVVRNNRVETRKVKTGLAGGALVEVREGLEAGDLVVARAGTFLRDGDAVRPVVADRTKVSEARQ